MGEETFNMSDEALEQHIVTLFEKLECMRRDGGGGGGSGSEVGCGRVPTRLELRSLALWKAVLAECAASFLYVFTVCGAAGGAGVGASTSAVLLATALAAGCAMATLTLCFSHLSGAHVNPAVSVAMCVRRRISPLRAALYVTAQCGGAIAGAAMLYGVTVPGYQGNLSAALSQWGGAAAWERLGAELVLTALVVAAHFAAAERRWAGAAPGLLGAAYCACSFVSMPYLNPARSLGPSFVLSKWESHWVYWVGPLGGAVCCGLLHEWGSRRRAPSAPPSEDGSYDDLDKGGSFPPQQFRHAATYCAAAAPRPDRGEPLYGGTKSLYCRSPPSTRHTLHRSQSVYSKGSAVGGAPGGGAGGPLVPAQSLLLRPHVHQHQHQHPLTAVHSQNSHNSQRDTAYGVAANGPRPGPAGAAMQERRESVYGSAAAAAGARRPALSQSDDSAYGSYSRAPYRPPPPPDHY